MKRITSLQNEIIKNVIKLNKAGERKKQNLFIVEGYRELRLCIKAGYEIVRLLVCDKSSEFGVRSSEYSELQTLNLKPETLNLIEVSETIYSRLAYRENIDGVIAIVKIRENRLSDIKLTDNPLVIVLETVEKPGNLGAILRTADASNVDAVIICDNQTDIYNPNTVRASLGTIFTNQIVCCSNEEALKWLKHNKIKTYATSLKSSKMYYDCNLKKATAVLMGSEAFGITDFWYKNSDELIKIPMKGKVDSLNVSVSTAIVIYEAIRQRTKVIIN